MDGSGGSYDPEAIAMAAISAEVKNIFSMLDAMEKPQNQNIDVGLNNKGGYPEWSGSYEFGPEVVVMESGGTRGYTKRDEKDNKNDALAFILTAIENVYESTWNQEYKYILSDIQTANWLEDDKDGSIVSKTTANGYTLYDKAQEYEMFANKYAHQPPTADIDSSQAQVIVNQETKDYIIGPLTMQYDYIEDVSYIKSMNIITDTGFTLLHDDWNNDFEILSTGEIASGSNGLKTEFPAANTQFYVKFSASKTNYPKDIKIGADFEYLKETYVKYNKLDAEANVYQYFGYALMSGEHAMRRAQGIGKATYSYEEEVTDYIYADTDNDGIKDDWVPNGSHWESRSGTVTIDVGNSVSYGVTIFQPFVKMGLDPVKTLDGQDLKTPTEGHRIYDVYSADTEIDLTFELGGRVWVDGTTGKENNFDGIFNTQTDTPMPNVKVSLYRVDGLDGNLAGVFEGATTTDSEGKYLFTNVNAMFQYYVKFTYNGQYYQPTIYNAKRDNPNWVNTSKGLDILKDRDDFNARFEEIGSAPQNTVGLPTKVEMHTRQELQDAGLIDEFGNIIGEVDENGNRTSSDEYVNYSMMDSYTCNGTSTKDLYPGFKVFVIDDYLNNLTTTQIVLEFIQSKTIDILYGNPDALHHINQGYVLRELVDLALRKDVYKTTLEINGKSQTYKYNKREGLETDENGNSYWDIKTRIEDGYYNYEYSRELYREDYDYKIDNYVMTNTNGNPSLETLGLTPDSELKIYVTYKYTIRNRSEAIATKVTEIVDYYDEDYTFVADRSYIGDNDGNKVSDLVGKDSSKYGPETQTTIDGYDNLYLTGANGGDFPLSDPDDQTKDVYFYVTFLVKKDSNRNNIVDEDVQTGELIGVGKENIAEINGYKSYYGQKAHAPNENNPETQPEYVPGDIAGIPDVNSTPGNLDPTDVPKDGKINYENFENDTDKAPNIRIIFSTNQPRTAKGIVWEDIRNVDEQLARIGDGVRKDETGINGVRVQLVEIRNGTDGNKYEYIWKEVYSGNTDMIDPIINNSNKIRQYQIDTTNANGKYEFRAFVPGDYVVRFIYGSGESSVLGTTSINYNTGNEQNNPVTELYNNNAEIPGYRTRSGDNGYSANNENIGLNKKSYNGQDYKSTTYQVNIDNGTGAYENNSTTSFTYNFSEADKGLYSDAKDIMNKKSDNVINIAPKAEYLVDCANSRKQVEDYSNGDEKNGKAEILASYESIPEYNGTKYSATDMKKLLDEFMKNTFMIAESGTIDVNFEYNRTGEEENVTNTSDTGHNNLGKENNYEMSGYYILDNLDLGLVQRPQAQLKVTKQITNVKVTLANNSVLFDASGKATNVLWIDHIAHGQDTKNTYSTKNNYKDSMMKTPIVRQQATNKGKVQLTMDEELMHGSTIQITYAITVANVGEVDYNEEQFYYTGKVGNKDTIVKTNPKMLVDYVGTQVHEYGAQDDKTATRNNLQFNAEQNPDWSVIANDTLITDGLVNNKLTENVNKYSEGHIIVTDKAAKDLIPIIADQENVKDKIKDAFSKNPLHALETVNKTQSVSGVQLILTQMITQDSDSDDRTYNNMVELVTTHNDVGRKMSYSVAGNQDPTMEPREIDADTAQEVVILPPFGQPYIYYVLGIAVAIILIAGISITIMVVRKKK